VTGIKGRPIDPRELIALARELLGDDRPVTNSHFRRAVSTAYYVLFHLILGTAAKRFIGSDRRLGAYAVFYRGFKHGDMRQACVELAKPILSPGLQRQLGRIRMSDATREFAKSFSSIQEQRHAADYDPDRLFVRSDVRSLVEATERTMEFFLAIELVEQADVLALMLVRSRP